MLFCFSNILIQVCGSSTPCGADHVINECFTGKMNLPNFHLPSLHEHIHEYYKSTQFMYNWLPTVLLVGATVLDLVGLYCYMDTHGRWSNALLHRVRYLVSWWEGIAPLMPIADSATPNCFYLGCRTLQCVLLYMHVGRTLMGQCLWMNFS